MGKFSCNILHIIILLTYAFNYSSQAISPNFMSVPQQIYQIVSELGIPKSEIQHIKLQLNRNHDKQVMYLRRLQNIQSIAQLHSEINSKINQFMELIFSYQSDRVQNYFGGDVQHATMRALSQVLKLIAQKIVLNEQLNEQLGYPTSFRQFSYMKASEGLITLQFIKLMQDNCALYTMRNTFNKEQIKQLLTTTGFIEAFCFQNFGNKQKSHDKLHSNIRQTTQLINQIIDKENLGYLNTLLLIQQPEPQVCTDIYKITTLIYKFQQFAQLATEEMQFLELNMINQLQFQNRTAFELFINKVASLELMGETVCFVSSKYSLSYKLYMNLILDSYSLHRYVKRQFLHPQPKQQRIDAYMKKQLLLNQISQQSATYDDNFNLQLSNPQFESINDVDNDFFDFNRGIY